MHLSPWKDGATALPLEQSFCSATLDPITAATAPSSPVTSPWLAAVWHPVRLSSLQHGPAYLMGCIIDAEEMQVLQGLCSEPLSQRIAQK